MFKRYTSILFLCLANLVMLGHSVVPHHHHSSTKEIVKDDHAHHAQGVHHDDDHPKGDEGSLPFHYAHASLPFIVGTDAGPLQQMQACSPCVLVQTLALSWPSLLHQPVNLPLEPPSYKSPPSRTPELRGPPFFIV